MYRSVALIILAIAACLAACDITISAATPPAGESPAGPTASNAPTPAPSGSPARSPSPTFTVAPPTPAVTPDPPRPVSPNLAELGKGWAAFSYTVQAGEELGKLAARYGLTYDQIRAANGLKGGEVLQPGQVILIPQKAQRQSPALKLIPDSELVYGPSTVEFDTLTFVARYKSGYLYNYTETVNGEAVSGAALVQRAAENYSLNPRLLLALLEFQSGWLTDPNPEINARPYPYGRAEGGTEGLFRQLGWAANALNQGFYGWRDGTLSLLILGDGTRVGMSAGLNAGTAAVQYFLSLTSGPGDWDRAIGSLGFSRTYTRLFGSPFEAAVEPLIPAALTQPELALPWQAGETWFYSGGPHGAYGSGSPWGAVDFLPPGNASGCTVSPSWATAVAVGRVVRSGDGQLLLDLDQDGYEQTGWVILYLHVAEQDRPPVGTHLERGDRVGHPACEGGSAKDAHLHLARKYNGAWLAAGDRLAPFVLGGYTLRSTGSEYNGLMEGFGTARAACACRASSNAIVK